MADKIHTVKQTDESCKCKFSPEDWMKIIGTITVALMCLAVTLLICFSIYKNGISVESILSMLLAFFRYLFLFSSILRRMKQVVNFMIIHMIL